MKNIAISIGDINGIGVQIALISHEKIKKLCNPIYIINQTILNQASKLLNIKIPNDFNIYNIDAEFSITPSTITKESGKHSYDSFKTAVDLAKEKKVDALTTLPIHKKAWELAGIKYVGHTDMLRDYFKKEAIMMLGCDKMYVALYTEHIPLHKVPDQIEKKRLTQFMLDFYNSTQYENIAVLGLNPHAGDDGVLGDEERVINAAIKEANSQIGKEIFIGSIVPDIAFTPYNRERFKVYIAMYHDQGLAALKALYFDEGINVSLNLPIIRTSVDHGTAFDIAYSNTSPSNTSYINAIKTAIRLADEQS